MLVNVDIATFLSVLKEVGERGTVKEQFKLDDFILLQSFLSIMNS